MMTAGLPGVTIFFASLVALAVQPGPVADFFSTRLFRWLGTISYGLYVFHVLLLEVIVRVSDRLAGSRSLMVHNSVQILVAAVLTTVAAVLSFHLYEKQFLRLKRYFIPTRSKPADDRLTTPSA